MKYTVLLVGMLLLASLPLLLTRQPGLTGNVIGESLLDRYCNGEEIPIPAGHVEWSGRLIATGMSGTAAYLRVNHCGDELRDVTVYLAEGTKQPILEPGQEVLYRARLSRLSPYGLVAHEGIILP